MTDRDTFNRAMDKLRDEMAKMKDAQTQLLGEGLTAMLQRHPEWAEHILKDKLTVAGALGAVRKNATGGCSDPLTTTKSLIDYYGIPCKDPHRLAIEVSMALMGEDTSSDLAALGHLPLKGKAEEPPTDVGAALRRPPEPDPFDLDALMGVL